MKTEKVEKITEANFVQWIRDRMDGRGISSPEYLLAAGFDRNLVDDCSKTHDAGKGKDAIRLNSGEYVTELFGVSNLDLVSRIADLIGADRTKIKFKYGRGSQFREYLREIEAVVERDPEMTILCLA